jgi:class 3 adenylate cyclase/ATP/maltotriose-dependent transcriptional regulator MalT
MADVQLTAVLFCDLVDSTVALASAGEEQFAVIRRSLERVVERAVGRQRGRIVKGLGDGAMAEFDTPSQALLAAVEIQFGVGSSAANIAMRIGISMGEVTLDEGDLFGIPVVEAARLCAAARPGQILTTATVAALARHNAAPLTPLGPLELKGLPEPIDTFEVDWSKVEPPAAAGSELPAALRSLPAFAFVARPDEWNELAGAWKSVCSGGRQLVLVSGEAGAGKTRLVAEFARQIVQEDAIVLYGGCREDAGPTLQPVLDALEHLGADQLDAVHSADERKRQFDAIASALADASRDAAVLLVLDDVHWAGPPPMQLILHLMHSPEPLRLCLVATHRDSPSDHSAALTDALADFHRLDGVTRVRVQGLDAAGVAAFVEAAASSRLVPPLRRAAEVLARDTDGNPFLLGELWRHLIESGALIRAAEGWEARPNLEQAGSPEAVRSVVGRRIDRLPASSRELLEVAAIAGSPFSVDLLARASGRDRATVLEELEPAINSATIQAADIGTFSFAHALVWRAIYDRLSASRRTRLHLTIAEALETLAETDEVLSERARHYIAAVPVADPALAVTAAERAAHAAMRTLAWENAAQLLSSVLPFVEQREPRARMLLTLADALLRCGDMAGALERLRECIELARAGELYELLIAATIEYEQAGWAIGRPGVEAEQLLREVLPLIPDEATRVRAMAARGRALALSGEPAGERVIEEAIEAARALGDPIQLHFAIQSSFNLPWWPERYPLLLERAREIKGLAGDDLDLLGNSLQWLCVALTLNAKFDELHGALDEHSRAAQRSGEPFHRHLVMAIRSTMAVLEGRFDEAERLAAEADAFAARMSGADVSGAYGVQMFTIRREQGRLDEVRPVIEMMARGEAEHSTWRPGLAAVYAELGFIDEARAEVRNLVTPGLTRLPRDSLFLASVTFLADAATAVGDRSAASTLYATLEPYRGTTVTIGHLIACYGAVDRYLGALAETAGRARDAERHYAKAIEIDGLLPSPVWLAHSRFRYANFLVHQGRRDGPRRAAELLDQVIESTRAIGMAALEQRATMLAAELDVGPREPAPIAVGEEQGIVGGLTAREREILSCLVDGLSNADIGKRLHISGNTAANHVRSILLKSGCANRTEAATWAVRQGLT